jgi:HK97 family phage prohead protease
MDNSRATFTVPVAEVEFASSGAGPGQRTMRGHAAVFNRLSHDLGGFRTKIAPGAFDRILDTNPDVHLVWDHDTRYVLARTKNNTLELRTDPYGLHVWSRWADTPTAAELATLMEGGYIDQMSFACNIGSSEWSEDDEGHITRTILDIDGLFDVTVCAQGAFPQTDAQLVASLHSAADDLASAIEAGRVSRRATPDHPAPETVGVEGTGAALSAGVEDVAPPGVPSLVAFKARTKARLAAATRPE